MMRTLAGTVLGPLRQWRASLVLLLLWAVLSFVGNSGVAAWLDTFPAGGDARQPIALLASVGNLAVSTACTVLMGPVAWLIALADVQQQAGRSPLPFLARLRRHGLAAWLLNGIASIVLMLAWVLIVPGLLLQGVLGVVLDPARLLEEHRPAALEELMQVLSLVALSFGGTILWFLLSQALQIWHLTALGHPGQLALQSLAAGVFGLLPWFWWHHMHARP